MEINKDLRYCMIVESPEKAKTISKIFKDAKINNVFVLATIGHFTKIADGSGYYNTGIHPEDNFKIDFTIDPNKKDLVSKLKEQVKLADWVIIASDCDREGEAIAQSCVDFLKISKSKYKRATYQAINQKAIFDAVKNASTINENLVEAAHSRSALDKGLGYRLSGIARNEGKGKSVGRCQSSALKMIVDREKEIIDFKPEKYFDLYLHFIKNNVEFKAKYFGTDSKQVKRLDTQEQIDQIYAECKGNPFVISSIEHKDRFEYPKPPFSTATFQQECANKLGLTVKQSADCAQKLFEAGKISYHRTDSEILSEESEQDLKQFVSENYPKAYVSRKVVQGKNSETAQEGHEALHTLDLTLTPEKFAKQESNELLVKVYKIIYNRTIAAALNPAIIAQTTYTINNKKHKFILNSNELKFDGYRCVYSYKDDSEEKEEIVKETFKETEHLKDCSFESIPQETKPKPRFKEASFIKELKDVGVGRPSTYATIIETIKSQDRGYCEVENKCLKPTEKGIQLINFLDENFSDLINVEYTGKMEKSLDMIAQGKLNYLEFLKEFFDHLEESASKISHDVDKKCPKCGAPLKIRKGKYGLFYGCSSYPNCTYIEPLKNNKNDKEISYVKSKE